jgi:uncharacterized FlgJ-related protein
MNELKNRSKKSLSWLVISLVLLAGLAIVYLNFLSRKAQAKKNLSDVKNDLENEFGSTGYANQEDTDANDLQSNVSKMYYKVFLQYPHSQAAKLIASIAGFESGNFDSYVYINNNNAFGLRMPKVRKTTAIEDRGGYAYYKNLSDSISDFILWFKQYDKEPKSFKNVNEIVTFMKSKNYFEGDKTKYAKGVSTYYNSIKDL